MAKERIDELLKLVKLEEAADRMVKTYSGGMRKRLELAEGLIHRPRVLFLDEPTLGLDIQTRTTMWEHIRELKKSSNMTVFMTTHYLEEADNLCDRIGIIDKGKIMALDTPHKLKESLGGDVISLKIGGEMDYTEAIKSVEGVLEREEGGRFLPRQGAERRDSHRAAAAGDIEERGQGDIRQPWNGRTWTRCSWSTPAGHCATRNRREASTRWPTARQMRRSS